MKIFTKASVAALLFAATILPMSGAASAESYSNPDTPNVGSHDSGGSGGTETPRGDEGSGGEDTPGAVLGENDEAPAVEETGGAPAGAEVLGESETAPAAAAAAETAPSGTLPFTGGDVVGMTVVGAAAVGIGAVMVRRSRRVGSSQTA
jgi:hypothetical protein